jgi:hypothetical protein
MATKYPFEVEAGSAHDRGYESVTFIFVYLGSFEEYYTKARIKLCEPEGFTYTKHKTTRNAMYTKFYYI